MRTYPANSPQAAARIVALTLISDGHVCKSELDLLDHLGAHQQLGLSRSELHQVVHGFCEDLLSEVHLSWSDVCRVNPHTLAALFAEIDDPALRLRLLRLCVAIAEADAHVADGEVVMLNAAVEHWGLHREMLAAPAA